MDALKGELGLKTRRWGAGENASDEDWLEYFMKRMEGIPLSKRTARFIAVGAFFDGKKSQLFRRETEGIITESLEAPIKEGIPLSSVFKPKGFDKVYAALTEEEKNKVSHRGKAFEQFKSWYKKLFI